jgi:hypothetical protein
MWSARAIKSSDPYPSSQAKTGKTVGQTVIRQTPKKSKTTPHPHRDANGIIDPPMVVALRELTPDEIGLRPDATLEEKWAHAEKYGRVQLEPKLIKDMRNHNAVVDDLLTASIQLAAPRHPTPAQFFAVIDALPGWVPQRDKPKESGWHIDFATKAREHLAELEANLPIALERLEGLLRILRARRFDRLEATEGQTTLLLN